MGRTKSRKLPVDVLKIIACFCVLLLHTCPPENHWFAQQPLYLLGVFGIPLFFMVNGYLLYSKELNCKYMSKKIVHNVRLVLCWSIPLTMLVSIKNFRGVSTNIWNCARKRLTVPFLVFIRTGNYPCNCFSAEPYLPKV